MNQTWAQNALAGPNRGRNRALGRCRAAITDRRTAVTTCRTAITDRRAAVITCRTAITDRRTAVTTCRAAFTERRAAITDRRAAVITCRAAFTDRRTAVTTCRAAITERRAAISERRRSAGDASGDMKAGRCVPPFPLPSYLPALDTAPPVPSAKRPGSARSSSGRPLGEGLGVLCGCWLCGSR